MKDYDLAEDFRTIFASDPAITDLITHCVNWQACADYKRPAAVFHVRTRPLDASGHALAFRLTIDVQTDGSERNDAGERVADVRHAPRVSAVSRKLYGDTIDHFAAAKAALTAALANLGHFTLLGYDAGGDETDPAVQPTQFETPVMIAGIVRVASI